MRWRVRKEVKINGKKLELWVPNPNLPRAEAIELFVRETEKRMMKNKGWREIVRILGKVKIKEPQVA